MCVVVVGGVGEGGAGRRERANERGGGAWGQSARRNAALHAMRQVMHHAALYAAHHVPPEAVRVGEALRVCALLLLDERPQLLGHHLRRLVHLARVRVSIRVRVRVRVRATICAALCIYGGG